MTNSDGGQVDVDTQMKMFDYYRKNINSVAYDVTSKHNEEHGTNYSVKFQDIFARDIEAKPIGPQQPIAEQQNLNIR